MRPVGYGRPGTRVFPADWQATHAPVVEDTFDSFVQIGPATGGPAAWNETSGQSESTAGAPVYSGPASIGLISDTSRLIDAAGEQVPVRRYEISLPVDTAGVDDDHVVHVVACPDQMLAGQVLTDLAIERGDRRFARALQATLQR